MLFYGLRCKQSGNLLVLSISSNGDDAEFCNSTTVELYQGHGDYRGDQIFLTADQANAEYVRNNSTPWYNSCVDHPKHDFKPEELEVVTFQMLA